jgi:hypothetical protein
VGSLADLDSVDSWGDTGKPSFYGVRHANRWTFDITYHSVPLESPPPLRPAHPVLPTSSPTSTSLSAPLTFLTSSSSSSTRAPLLTHCRKCYTSPCIEPTATLCGHLFCNQCITESLIASSSCPKCRKPTLLYCLFRLELER